ncbi:Glyoxylate reductase [Sulfitobacter noctilucicola]|uniref:Lactate dehydrogenase-like 2-hydroxyacid dehydrogenase n=1 Tax=Sulfitobacter noctilucicola TaxID=1342301 RepID=A0A7W6Q5W8_9RHOB|nr:D-glycerate dehydrogenase [Sulfitobacter noctilucicola]KIN70152.1 Glyoxylate reductase [Sulfitobacter noctilucicola]MBB4176153.1 lactate dehydrogenase-like 2-hydroxyacid dehydrogenase [Sulfitobacter noctilucicola]
MSKKRLWITRRLSDATLERAARDYDVVINHEDLPGTAEQLIAASAEFDAIIPCHSEHFSADVVAQFSDRLKIVANHSVGVDHCNLPALKDRGIAVTNTPDVLSDATAELAMLLMLGAARNAVAGDRIVRSGEWDSWSPAFMVGKQVTGSRLGIIGMGRVGRAFAAKARGFDMDIHYYNRTELPADQAHGAIYHTDVESLLGVADFLSLHCPATPETTNLMDNDRFALLPRGAVVVNSARGALVDEAALLDALKSGQVAAAGLDCFQVEPGGNPAFAAHDNIFMLPHIGSATRKTRDAMGFRALDNLDAFFAGQTPGDLL